MINLYKKKLKMNSSHFNCSVVQYVNKLVSRSCTVQFAQDCGELVQDLGLQSSR